MHKIIKITFLYILLVFISNAALSENISPSEADILSKSNIIMIIDVRNKSEWKETGIIPGANLVQMLNPIFKIRKDFVKEIIEVLGPDKTISAAIICKSGGRSSATVAILNDNGYVNIKNIVEGMVGDEKETGWISRGLAIEKCLEKCK